MPNSLDQLPTSRTRKFDIYQGDTRKFRKFKSDWFSSFRTVKVALPVNGVPAISTRGTARRFHRPPLDGVIGNTSATLFPTWTLAHVQEVSGSDASWKPENVRGESSRPNSLESRRVSIAGARLADHFLRRKNFIDKGPSARRNVTVLSRGPLFSRERCSEPLAQVLTKGNIDARRSAFQNRATAA